MRSTPTIRLAARDESCEQVRVSSITSSRSEFWSINVGGNNDSDAAASNQINSPLETSGTPLKRESATAIATQIFLPYLIAGFGMVGAGLVLDIVQHWNVFRSVTQIFIMVPALIGLKGNLEMTLASRLSTQSNLGTMDKPHEFWLMAVGNIVLTQAQAIVVGFLVSVAAVGFSWISTGEFDWATSVLLGASAVITSSLASLLLGTVVILVIFLSRKCSVNPDNVATPVAASLGDLSTLCLLALVSSFLFSLADSAIWFLCILLLLFLAITPIWIYIARQNPYTRVVVYDGWLPVVSAMLISSFGGIILEHSVARFPGLAAYQPVINGVGGNLAAIQASRLSTALHQLYLQPGRFAIVHRHSSGDNFSHLSPRFAEVVNNSSINCDQEESPRSPDDGIILRRSVCPSPIDTFLSSHMHSRTARVLLLISVPGHLTFMYTIHCIIVGNTNIHLLFVFAYLSATTIQIVFLLYITRWLVQFLWRCGKDPDNFAIPYLTAIGDILGTGLLAVAFHILNTLEESEVE